jgi:hypothetical protein
MLETLNPFCGSDGANWGSGDACWDDQAAQEPGRAAGVGELSGSGQTVPGPARMGVTRDELKFLESAVHNLRVDGKGLAQVFEALEQTSSVNLASLEVNQCRLICSMVANRLANSETHAQRTRQQQAVWSSRLVSKGWAAFKRYMLGDDAELDERRAEAREQFSNLKPAGGDSLAAYVSAFTVTCAKARTLGVDSSGFKELRDKFTRSLPEGSQVRQVAVTLHFAELGQAPFEGADMGLYNLNTFLDKVRSEYAKIHGQAPAWGVGGGPEDDVVVAPAQAGPQAKCFQFSSTGSCSFGEKCKFQHSRGAGGRDAASAVGPRPRPQPQPSASWTRPPARNYSQVLKRAEPERERGSERERERKREQDRRREGERRQDRSNRTSSKHDADKKDKGRSNFGRARR